MSDASHYVHVFHTSDDDIVKVIVEPHPGEGLRDRLQALDSGSTTALIADVAAIAESERYAVFTDPPGVLADPNAIGYHRVTLTLSLP